MRSHPLHQFPQEWRCPFIDLLPHAVARSGDVEHADRVFINPFQHLIDTRIFAKVDNKARLTQLGGQSFCQSRPAAGFADRKNERAVRIANVPFRSLRVRPAGRLGQRIAVVDRPVGGQAPARTPTATGHSTFEGDIERRPVDARLPAGNDLTETQGGAFNGSF